MSFFFKRFYCIDLSVHGIFNPLLISSLPFAHHKRDIENRNFRDSH